VGRILRLEHDLFSCHIRCYKILVNQLRESTRFWQRPDADLRGRRDVRQSYFKDSGASLYFGRASQGRSVCGPASLPGGCEFVIYTSICLFSCPEIIEKWQKNKRTGFIRSNANTYSYSFKKHFRSRKRQRERKLGVNGSASWLDYCFRDDLSNLTRIRKKNSVRLIS